MAVIGSGGGPNIAGRKEQKKPAKTRHPSQPGGPGNRSAVKRGTSRDILSKMPPTIVEDFNRRAAEVEFAKESWQWSGNLDGAYEKYGELISRKRLQAIYNKPDKYIKQLGIGADSAIKNQQGLASIKGFQKYVNKTLTEAAEKTRQLNKYLFPGGHDRSNIVKSIHFGHGQGLMAGGANIGGSYTAQMPLDNMRQGKQSGPSRGAIGSDGWYKVDDAYSAIDHPQFWDEAWSNYILGKDMPILVELTDDAKNKVLHRGYNPDRVIIEQDNINLNRIDDDVAESIPFRRKGPPPKGEILTINGRPPDPIQPTPQVMERGKGLGGLPSKINVGDTLRNTLSIRNLKNVAASAIPDPITDGLFSVALPALALASKGEMEKIPGVVGRNLAEDAGWAVGLNLAARTPWGQTAIRAATPFVEPVVSTLLANPIAAAGGLIAADIAFGQGAGAGSAPFGSGTPYKDQDEWLYKMGGGNAAMTKYGWTIEQTMLRGRKNLAQQEASMYKNGGYTAD